MLAFSLCADSLRRFDDRGNCKATAHPLAVGARMALLCGSSGGADSPFPIGNPSPIGRLIRQGCSH
jgi:hypothetical protein